MNFEYSILNGHFQPSTSYATSTPHSESDDNMANQMSQYFAYKTSHWKFITIYHKY
jgi:hypothetical protein